MCCLVSTASEAEDSADTAGAAPAPPAQKSASLLAAIAASDAPVGSELKELDFDEGAWGRRCAFARLLRARRGRSC